MTSELTLMEVLTGAHRVNDPVLEADYRRMLGNPAIRLLPIDQAILSLAAKLRGRHPALRTPDAIHVATADLSGCGVFVTNDKALRKVASPSVVILDEL